MIATGQHCLRRGCPEPAQGKSGRVCQHWHHSQIAWRPVHLPLNLWGKIHLISLPSIQHILIVILPFRFELCHFGAVEEVIDELGQIGFQ